MNSQRSYALIIVAGLIIAAGAASAVLTIFVAEAAVPVFPLLFWPCLFFGGIFGLPLYAFYKSRRRPTWLSTAAAGALAGIGLPALLMMSPPDGASANGVETVVNGSYTAAGWIENLQYLGVLAAAGAVGGLSFWMVVHGWHFWSARGGGSSGRASRIFTIAALTGGAAVSAAVVGIPEANRDRSCHSAMPWGQNSMSPEATFDLKVEPDQWQEIAAMVEAYARELKWAHRADVRPFEPYLKWFQVSICTEGMIISLQGEERRVMFAAYQPEGSEGWRRPFVELYQRMHSRWAGQIEFRGKQGEPIKPPAWVPTDEGPAR